MIARKGFYKHQDSVIYEGSEMRDSLNWMSRLCLLALLSIALAISFKVEHCSVDAPSTGVITVPQDYSTIQAAVDAAAANSTIVVMPGKYVECIRITKTLTLVGSGVNRTIIESSGQGHTIEITRGTLGVTVRGFTIGGIRGAQWSGICQRGLYGVLEDNFVTGHRRGIEIYDSSGDILRNNTLNDNADNLEVWGLSLSHFLHDIDSSNLVNGRIVVYWTNQQNRTVPVEAGYVGIVNSSRVLVKDLNVSFNFSGILLAYTNDSLLMNITSSENERGLHLVCSDDNAVLGCDFSDNSFCGISTVSSSNNIFAGNVLSGNSVNGIRLSHSFPLVGKYSDNNTFVGNNVTGNLDGVYLENAHNNVICGNLLVGNVRSGVSLDESTGNLLSKNTVRDNRLGVWAFASGDRIYRNNFLNNSVQVDLFAYAPSYNIWDNGYPSGGNYWSDYEEVHPTASQLDASGLWNTSYVMNDYNQDRYPLMNRTEGNASPKAGISYSPSDARVQESVLFSDESSDGDGWILLRLWEIEGSYDWFSKQVSVSFKEEKPYSIKLTVVDNEGAIETAVMDFSPRRFLSFLYLSVRERIELGESVNISVQLLGEDEFPLADARIVFYLIVGNSEKTIGFAVTNASGITTLLYSPSEGGDLKVRALFFGNEKYAPAGNICGLTIEKTNPALWPWILVGVGIASAALFVIRLRRQKKRKESFGKSETNEMGGM